jgi:mono/diheme cytochrome c family protein
MRSLVIVLGVMLASVLACDSGRKSATGFRLPEGDVERGKVAVLDLKCHACHEIAGDGFPEPVADPPVPVRLGGETPYVRTDGQFVSSIVNPSHQLAYGFRKELVESGDESRMANYNEVMTVEQLIDMVAFLQSIYDVKPPPPMH